VSRVDEIRARAAAARAEYTTSEPDQPTRDIEYLLTGIDAAQRIMPRGAWLWPDDRTGMEWATEHDERL
jgi:hypothetical protein